MDFDLQWLLVGLPVAFALGWLGSRLDLRQVRREHRESPKAYFKGLNLLLNEQQDKAIDAFIEAVQNDPDTTELHFALGNLFRRRGEFERAVRVHQHLLGRSDLGATERDRAQHALAQDFMKAGLFDRAEQCYKALEGTPFDTEARLALLNLYERSRDWRAAADTAAALERSGIGSFGTRIAHHWCELAQEADARGQGEEAASALQHARAAAPQAARPLMLAGQREVRAGRPAAALELWGEMRLRDPASFHLVAADYAQAALAAGKTDAARVVLTEAYEQNPDLALLRAVATLDGSTVAQSPRLLHQLQVKPTLSAAQALLARADGHWSAEETEALRAAVDKAAKPLQRYRCAACGFEAQRYFWQCPGCLGWDSFPPHHVEEL
ncbi:lipopolysaccharide assembly protein LapB [Ideonella azotifigens]|uniref:Lipopolysaccharide assembly protein B n=2 Tax=Ideonella azotifigens TaxID=513160 RepID=A0ABN1JY71_9BURK|nr:lipopolysaccharide assembly protein LapB [Ideonella azotifigens]MCD2341373.1 lipopolysaccharide assembly protein LapB [Ideonella azotifigens]